MFGGRECRKGTQHENTPAWARFHVGLQGGCRGGWEGTRTRKSCHFHIQVEEWVSPPPEHIKNTRHNACFTCSGGEEAPKHENVPMRAHSHIALQWGVAGCRGRMEGWGRGLQNKQNMRRRVFFVFWRWVVAEVGCWGGGVGEGGSRTWKPHTVAGFSCSGGGSACRDVRNQLIGYKKQIKKAGAPCTSCRCPHCPLLLASIPFQPVVIVFLWVCHVGAWGCPHHVLWRRGGGRGGRWWWVVRGQ